MVGGVWSRPRVLLLETALFRAAALRLNTRVRNALRSCFVCLLLGAGIPSGSAAPAVREIVVTNNLVLDVSSRISARLIIQTSHVTVDGAGATLVGPGRVGDTNSLAEAGVGILVEGAVGVTLKNIHVQGFATGLVLRHTQAVSVLGCDFSDNYHNPGHGWGELPPRGGILCEHVRQSVFRGNRANRVWDGIHLVDSDENLVADNDFSHCSNTAAKLWKSCRNRFLNNNLSYGIRIDRAAGEVHARDSSCILIETGSDNNYWYQNDMTYGGDGIFIRPLNRWVSRGNVFIENDTSHANNNCVESWSPGNTFIRNKANHGSYGFWLGGSDQTVLIGNEAAFNGQPEGNHNAPEPGFGHGGIVIVGGSSTHTVLDGNYVHHNRGAGIAFRGDVGSRGVAWQTEHWVVQRNRILDNQFGIWGRWANAIVFAANQLTNNGSGNYLTNVTGIVDLPDDPKAQTAPMVELSGPETAFVGEEVVFDASRSRDLAGRTLRYHWSLGSETANGPTLRRRFETPGFYRLCLTVDNGGLAGLGWRDVLVTERVDKELGTEEQAGQWGFELENDSGQGRVIFADEGGGVVGKQCLRFTPHPYPGAYATVIYPNGRDARWDLTGKDRIRFWIKSQNPNLPGYQNAGPVLRLIGPNGHIEFKPTHDANLLNDPPYSEARWSWMRVEIPLAGDARWARTVFGDCSLQRIDAISLGLDSWGGDPFTVWLDGLAVQ